ncbi:MAG: hypothetical protein KGR26_13930, partial [Cyanobacteria bacterium REEB65]|nr:hypothetical protein [Cyanobacteria bacterium REEB65]
MTLLTLLAERDRAAGRRIDLAIVGTAKNVGKTTTLNHLLERLGESAEEAPLGLTSVGRDGEEFDAVTDLPKPRVHPPLGTLVATAKAAAARSGHALAFVADTGCRTALGDIGLYRVVDRTPVEIAGPITAGDSVIVVMALRQAGAARVIIDGAIDRRASASARVAGGVVLATGMALLDQGGGRLARESDAHGKLPLQLTASVADATKPPDERIAEVARQTEAIVRMLSLPASEPDLALVADQTGAWLKSGAFVAWQGGPTLDQGELLVHWLSPEAEALVLSGALTEGVAQALLRSGRRHLALIVPDGTHVLCSSKAFNQLGERD